MSIQIKNLNFTYDKGLVYEKQALVDVSMLIPDTGITGIIGHSGSGKSTLIQHFNALIAPQEENTVLVDDQDLFTAEGSLSWLRKKVGMVFQYPENQLFEETVQKELSFGPKNCGLSEEEIDHLSRQSLELVGLQYEEYFERSPFMLSGGEKRKVAIADILAMNPKYLILDEPTAGLDPVARKELLENIIRIQKNQNMSVVIVSHDMEEIAEVSDYVYVMNKGRIQLQGKALDVFVQKEQLHNLHLSVPETIEILSYLHHQDTSVNIRHTEVPDTCEEIMQFVKRRGSNGI